MTHPADAYIRARDAACASVGTPRECMGAPRASGHRDRTSERVEGCACTSGGHAWAWWMHACVCGDPAGTDIGRRGDPVGTDTGVRGDPAGTGVRGSSRHGRAEIQQARSCGDPAGTDGRAWAGRPVCLAGAVPDLAAQGVRSEHDCGKRPGAVRRKNPTYSRGKAPGLRHSSCLSRSGGIEARFSQSDRQCG